jgi:lysophospholipase L1-like esterase
MKKIIPLFLFSTLMISCNTSSSIEISSLGESVSHKEVEINILNVVLYEEYSSLPLQVYIDKKLTANYELSFVIADESIARIENGYAIPVNVGLTTVQAFDASNNNCDFTIRVYPATSYRFNTEVLIIENQWKNNKLTNPTVFIGDSFFDTRNFWKTFNNDFQGLNAFSSGISATMSTDLMLYRDRLLYSYNPKNIIMHIGTNDVNDDPNKQTSSFYYKQITTFLKEVIEKTEVPIYYFGIEQRVNSMNNTITDVVTNQIRDVFAKQNTERFTYLDTPSVFNIDKPRYISGDGVHPSQEGYAYYTSLLKETVDF